MMATDKTQFLQTLTSWRFRLHLLTRLPAAAFMGARVIFIDGQAAKVRMPYRWRSQNPFQSVYFAAQLAAAELSTGVLVLSAIYPNKNISMLVVHAEADFHKKANGDIIFECKDGALLEAAVARTLASGEGETVRTQSVGTLANGIVVSTMTIVWAIKRKK